jgi:hypothetical protein
MNETINDEISSNEINLDDATEDVAVKEVDDGVAGKKKNEIMNEIINDKISSNETKVDDAIEDAVVTESDDDDDDELFKAKSPWDK